METSALCLVFGSLVSVIVSTLKRIPFVRNNPKWVALIINAFIGAWTATHHSAPGIDYSAIAECVLAQFATSVAFHEVVVNEVKDAAGARYSSGS